ncbi:hypothetical protein HPP92_027467, partial [Vanilla planifolia]
KNTEIKCESLDILCDVLHRFGNLMTKDHAELLSALLSQLNVNQASVRKKSVSCIVDLLDIALGLILRKPFLYSSAIALLHLKLMKNCGSTVCRCPRDISSYCDDILNLTLEFLSYDPNFTDSMDEDTDDDGHDDEEDDESANEYTDDEDISWKVRRAAAKCLAAIIVSRPEMLSKMYLEACPKLIERFREREENVKMDVFNTFIELLRQTANVTKGQNDIDESSPRFLLKHEVPKIVRSIIRQFREKIYQGEGNVWVGAFSVLKELVVVLPDCLADHDKSSTSNLKIEALTFTRLILASHSPTVFHPYIKALSNPILSAVGERYYKVTAEALRVCGELVHVIRPTFETCTFDFKAYVPAIYKAILARLANQDQDQEVKECAISCMSLVISIFGDNLQMELPTCLPILVDRMGNEITRLTAVKAFAIIASSPLRLDLSCVLEQVVSELTAFLRKANRALRQATLGTLNSLLIVYGDRISSSAYEIILVELSTLISDMDLHMTALALELCCTSMKNKKSSESVGLIVRQKVLPQALILIRSSLLQGQALQVLQKFFASLVHSANTSFDVLLDSLLSSARPSQQYGGLSKQAIYSIAQCVAELCLAAGDKKCACTVEMLKGILKDDGNVNSAKKHLALLCLGEVGRRKDLSNHTLLENIVIESFQSPFEEIKSAASYALGNIAVGNLSKYLPFILDQIDNQQKKQYLLLHSLKEVIARQSSDKAGHNELEDVYIEKILALLFNHCESEEEGVRNVVAECLGKIALVEPRNLIPALKQELIRTVDLGPFKHTVDDGLEIRKAAFECVDTLLDNCLDQVNPSSFIVPYLISGLSDHYDVKMPCHLILSKLADKCPAAVLAVLDSLVEPLQKTINHKPKLDAVKQEVDRNEDMIRSALRAIASLSHISGGDCSMKFKMLLNHITNSTALHDKYSSVRSE